MQNGCRKGKKKQPVAIEKSFIQEIGSKPATITSNNESEFIIEISNEKESKAFITITSLCFPQFQERVEVENICLRQNQSTPRPDLHPRI